MYQVIKGGSKFAKLWAMAILGPIKELVFRKYILKCRRYVFCGADCQIFAFREKAQYAAIF